MLIKYDDLVNSELWRLFPVINVDRCDSVPIDYVGAMGVPITFFANYMAGKDDGKSGFKLLGLATPMINGKAKYKRFIIRNLKPKLPDVVDLSKLFEQAGVEVEIVPVKTKGVIENEHNKEYRDS